MDIDIIWKLDDWTLFTCKNLFGLTPVRPKYAELGKSTRLTFWVSVPNVFEFISQYLYPLTLRRFIYKTVSGFMT